MNIQIAINVEIRSDCKFSRKLNEIKFMKARVRRSKFVYGVIAQIYNISTKKIKQNKLLLKEAEH